MILIYSWGFTMTKMLLKPHQYSTYMRYAAITTDGWNRLISNPPVIPNKDAQHHPTTSSTLCRTPHLNNKQHKNTNPIISRQDYHLTQPCPSEGKQTNKNSAQISPYTKLTQTTGPTLGGQKPKGRKNSTFFKEKIQLCLKPGKRRPQTQ